MHGPNPDGLTEKTLVKGEKTKIQKIFCMDNNNNNNNNNNTSYEEYLHVIKSNSKSKGGGAKEEKGADTGL
jgi:hypothetical protein